MERIKFYEILNFIFIFHLLVNQANVLMNFIPFVNKARMLYINRYLRMIISTTIRVVCYLNTSYP